MTIFSFFVYPAFLFNIVCYIIAFKQKTTRYLSITDFWSLASAILLCFAGTIMIFALQGGCIIPFWNAVYLFSIFLATVYYCSKLNKSYNRYQALWLQKLAIIFLVLITTLLPTILVLYSFNNFRFLPVLEITSIIELTIILSKLEIQLMCELLYFIFLITSSVTFYNYLKYNVRLLDKILAGAITFFCIVIYINLIIIPQNTGEVFRLIYDFLHTLSVMGVLVISGLKYIDNDKNYTKEGTT